MRWSWRILRVAGIGIHVHITFLLLPLWVAFIAYSERHLWSDASMGVGFILVLFGIVVLHELGHALTARRFGIRTRDITLLPIGGVARLERMPENPRQELLVALAGPAVNVGIALLCFAVLGMGAQLSTFDEALAGWTFLQSFLVTLMWVNVALTIFNLVPAFPMDGGRVLRALLATRLSYVRATNLAAGVGQTIALIFGFIGLSSIFFGHLGPISNPFLLFIALFVWVGASQEAGSVQLKSTLGRVPVRSVMITDFRTLLPAEPLALAAQRLLTGWQQEFPVVEEGRLVGLLTHAALVDGLAQRGGAACVGEVMSREFPTIDPDASSETALAMLRSSESRTLLVLRDGELLGILNREHFGEYLTISAALRGEMPGQGTSVERRAA